MTRPHCKYHPGVRMRLVAAHVPWFTSPSEFKTQQGKPRKIFRCKVEGCPWVETGPTDEAGPIAGGYSMELIQPW